MKKKGILNIIYLMLLIITIYSVTATIQNTDVIRAYTFDTDLTTDSTGNYDLETGEGDPVRVSSSTHGGYAVDFDGNDGLLINTTGFTASDFTYSFWFNTTQLNPDGHILGSNADANNRLYSLVKDGVTLSQQLDNNFLADTTASAQTWYNIVVVVNTTGGLVSVYKDGANVVNDTDTYTEITLMSCIPFGAQASDCSGAMGGNFFGMIDEFYLFNRGLEKDEAISLTTSFYPFIAPPPVEDIFIITANNTYNGTQLLNLNVYFTNGTLINSTTNGTLKTYLNGTVESFYIESTDKGGFYNLTYTDYNTSTDLNTLLEPLFYTFELDFLDYLNYSSLNYSRNLSYYLNYSCPDFSETNLVIYVNGSLNNTFNMVCSNTSLIYNNSFVLATEGEFNLSFLFNTTTSGNNKIFENQSFISDLYNPTITFFNLSYQDGFFQPVGNLTLICTDNVFNTPFYNLSLSGTQLFYNETTSGDSVLEEINLTSGSNIAYARCSDLFGSDTETITRTVYARNIYLINERNNSLFDVNNLTNVKVYFDDNSTSFDFKTAGTNEANFTSAVTNKLRFEFEYSNGDIITRYVDVTLGHGNLRVCANTDPTTYYEQLIISASQRKVSLNNVFSSCTVGEDYTRFVYQDSFILRTLTIDSLYYLYTYDSSGDKVYLASLDGSLSSYYNLDTLEFNLAGITLDPSGQSLTFDRIDNDTIRIYYKNSANDSVSTNLTIIEYNTSNIVFSVVETDAPNDFLLEFDFSTLGYDDKQIFKITVITTDEDGNERIKERFFNLSGTTGFLSSGMVFIIALLLTIFGLTFTTVKISMGWFGLIIQVLSIGILTFAVSTWYITFLMATNMVLLVYIGLIMFSNKEQLAVT